MAVTCRCGETLKVRSGDPDRLTCPRCGAKIRIRRSPAQRPEAMSRETATCDLIALVAGG